MVIVKMLLVVEMMDMLVVMEVGRGDGEGNGSDSGPRVVVMFLMLVVDLIPNMVRSN